MTKMMFRINQLTFIQKQSIILDYNIKILNLLEKDKIFLSGALGNYSLAGFQMVSEWCPDTIYTGSDKTLGTILRDLTVPSSVGQVALSGYSAIFSSQSAR